MPAILSRIFLLYNLLLLLLPKKLRLFLPKYPTAATAPAVISPGTTHHPSPPSSPPSDRMESAELDRVFQMFDKNGDGRISQKELKDSLENLGIYIPDKELMQMIERIDVDGDGCVDIDEFGALYKSIMDERDEEEDMKEAFNVFDQNGDGFITFDELKDVLGNLGLKQGRTAEDCKLMIMKVDVDGDGMVDFKEFRQMMKGGGFNALT